MKRHRFYPETESVRGAADLEKRNAPMAQPIYQTSTFTVTDSDQQLRATSTDMFYTRYGNPTHTAVERAIAALEGADAALLFASGMNAITTSILALVKTGDHIVAQSDIYGGVTKFLSSWLPKFGIETTFVDTTDYEQHRRAIRPNTKLFYLESPTNPTLKVVDLGKVVGIAREHKLTTFIDATFATPINLRPIEAGIDLVLHSATKYLSGHTDLICGVAAGRRDLIDTIRQTRTTLGGVMDPHAAFMLLRGMKTLAVRVERQNESALKIAQFLASHSGVKSVNYPLLDGHAQRGLAMQQMKGGGGIVSFEVDGSGEDAKKLSESLRLFTLAPSLGGVESLVSIPVLTSHAMISAEHRQKMGVTDQLIRLSVGIENADDLIFDLEQALAAISTDQSARIPVTR
jgi:cystathionine beta-lyase/cystathionine gamma-synthase